MVNDEYVNCKDCMNQDDCYIWYIVECAGVECPCKITNDDEEEE